MATPLTASGFRRIGERLKARGIAVRFYPGWDTRGRPGTWGPTNGFIWHHTGSDAQSDDYLKFLFVDGRASEGIPGPLCQFAIRSNGEVWIGAVGRANHAGKGSSRTLNHVMAEDYNGYSSELDAGADDIDGNARYLGVEIMYAGTHGMTSAQYKAAVNLAAEVMREFGENWTALSCIGHREHSARKWDPGSHKLYTMRQSTRNALAGAGEEDDMPYKDWPLEDRQQLAADVVNRLMNEMIVSAWDDKPYPFETFVRWTNARVHAIQNATKKDAISQAVTQALNAQPDPVANVDVPTLAAALAPLLPGGTDQATIEAALRNVLPELVLKGSVESGSGN